MHLVLLILTRLPTSKCLSRRNGFICFCQASCFAHFGRLTASVRDLENLGSTCNYQRSIMWIWLQVSQHLNSFCCCAIFVQSNGSQDAYWRVLSDAGITRQRLEGFDRPIVTNPHFWPDKKNSLIGEFRNYLGILKAVHSGNALLA